MEWASWIHIPSGSQAHQELLHNLFNVSAPQCLYLRPEHKIDLEYKIHALYIFLLNIYIILGLPLKGNFGKIIPSLWVSVCSCSKGDFIDGAS